MKEPPAAGSPPTGWTLSSKTAVGVINSLTERAETLVDDVQQTIMAAPLFSESVWKPPPIGQQTTCTANIRSIVGAVASSTVFDTGSAMQNGADRARQRLEVPAMIEGDRIAFRRLWQILVDEAAGHPNLDDAALHSMLVNLHAADQLYLTAMFAGYRDQHRRQVIEELSQRSLMMDTLLYGHTHDAWKLWEVANFLRLPTDGPFVVIAAEVHDVGYQALPEIESKLHSLDVYSAWRLLPDLQLGIAHVASGHHCDRILALLTRMATHRVGVSARFDDLRDTPHALHFAKVSLRGEGRAGGKVAVFDGSMLATAAVSAPNLMVRSAAATLDGFGDLSHEDRDMLFDTFRVWLDNDASVRDSADALFVHPNTVRKRLHRIEQRTGRSLSRPRDVIELSLALEVHDRLMRPNPA
jgi:PucR C-terminal helix-turn-helix domain/GGDEF-like domain